MIRRFSPCRQSVHARCAGFTLIELLTVIAIILVLAGLLLNVAGNANYKSSVARATAEIKAMETALESYKADNGAYPRDANSTDKLNAQTNGTPADPSTYAAANLYLYQSLIGYNTSTSTYGKKYMEFKPGQLSTGTGAGSSPTATYIIDPFGFNYGYSTINLSAQDGVNNGTNQPPLSTSGYNPTFDLWSTAGYSTSGKSYPNGASSGSAAIALWAKNW